MEKISRLTKNNLFKGSMDRAANAALICHLAKKCLGEFFKKSFLKEIEIVSFHEGTLFIATSSPVYAQEIKMKEKEISNKINLDLRDNLVGRIKFRSHKQVNI